MTDKELRKLSRRDLLEILVQQEEENEQLRKKIAELEEKVYKQTIQAEKAGTMAEASLVLNEVFERADRAAAQYLETIKLSNSQQESVYEQIVRNAEKKARAILEAAEREKQQKIKDADDYWRKLSTRLEEFYQSHEGLRELIEERKRRKINRDR